MKISPKVRKEIINFAAILLVILAFRSSVAEPYQVPTGSMIPTILPGDRLLVMKTAYGVKLPFTQIQLIPTGKPERGDIIVFRYPVDTSVNFIKRLIGLPGDTVEVMNGTIKINGEALPLIELTEIDRSQVHALLYREKLGSVSYSVQRLPEVMQYLADDKPVTFQVPEGHYFFMGDNRDDSNDSRKWGFVPESYIKGKAKFVWLSLDTEQGWIPKVRWNRFGAKL